MQRLILVLGLIIMVVSGAAAQELTDEEQELIARVVAASDTIDGYTSYVENRFVTDTQNITITAGEETQNIVETSQMNAVATIILGDNPAGLIEGSVSVYKLEGETPIIYTLEVEVRYVDEVLYVNAAVVGEESVNPPSLPEGWFVVDDLEAYPVLSDLNLDGFLELFEAETDDPNPVTAIGEVASSVVLEQDEIDGVPVDVITLTAGAEALTAMLASDPEQGTNPFLALLQELEDELGEEVAVVSVALAEDDVVLGNFTAMSVDIAGADLAIMMPQAPEGSTLDVVLANSALSEYSEINAEFDPIEAPEIGE